MQSVVFLTYFFRSYRRKTFGGSTPGTGRVNNNDALHTVGSLNSDLQYRDRFTKRAIAYSAVFKEFNVPTVHTWVTLSAFEICMCIA